MLISQSFVETRCTYVNAQDGRATTPDLRSVSIDRRDACGAPVRIDRSTLRAYLIDAQIQTVSMRKLSCV